MSSDWFVINNFSEFVEASRKLVFNNFGKLDDDSDVEKILVELSEKDQKELDSVLSYNESASIIKELIKEEKNKKTKESRYLVDTDSYILIITKLNDRLVSNILNSLVNRGLVETAYDEKINDFIFWSVENPPLK